MSHMYSMASITYVPVLLSSLNDCISLNTDGKKEAKYHPLTRSAPSALARKKRRLSEFADKGGGSPKTKKTLRTSFVNGPLQRSIPCPVYDSKFSSEKSLLEHFWHQTPLQGSFKMSKQTARSKQISNLQKIL